MDVGGTTANKFKHGQLEFLQHPALNLQCSAQTWSTGRWTDPGPVELTMGTGPLCPPHVHQTSFMRLILQGLPLFSLLFHFVYYCQHKLKNETQDRTGIWGYTKCVTSEQGFLQLMLLGHELEKTATIGWDWGWVMAFLVMKSSIYYLYKACFTIRVCFTLKKQAATQDAYRVTIRLRSASTRALEWIEMFEG